MISKEELSAIKADWQKITADYFRFGHAPPYEVIRPVATKTSDLVAEVERLHKIEQCYSPVRCGLKKRGTEDRCPNPAEHNVVGHGALQVCDECFMASIDGKAEIWRESEIRKELGE